MNKQPILEKPAQESPPKAPVKAPLAKSLFLGTVEYQFANPVGDAAFEVLDIMTQLADVKEDKQIDEGDVKKILSMNMTSIKPLVLAFLKYGVTPTLPGPFKLSELFQALKALPGWIDFLGIGVEPFQQEA